MKYIFADIDVDMQAPKDIQSQVRHDIFLVREWSSQHIFYCNIK